MKRVDNNIQFRIISLLLLTIFLSLLTLFLVQESNFSESLSFTDLEENQNLTIKTCDDVLIKNIQNNDINYTFSYKFIVPQSLILISFFKDLREAKYSI